MPINVIRIEKGKKNRVYMYPGLSIGGDRPSLNITLGPNWIGGTTFDKAASVASDVYVTTEIDDKVDKTDERISKEVEGLKVNIANGLKSVTESVGKLQGSILNDERFRMAIVEEVITELERRGVIRQE